jgi:hypothetical protein
MTVKVIPNSDLYRENFDKVFKGRRSSTVEQLPYKRQVGGSIPSGGTILDCFPDRVFMTSPLPATWGMVNGRPF